MQQPGLAGVASCGQSRSGRSNLTARVVPEIKSLTSIRGISAVYVMIFHYIPGVPLSNPATTFIAHGYLAVDLFFVLSGFVMALNYGQMFESGWSFAVYRKFLGRRVARIYPLYVAATAAAYILIQLNLLHWPNLSSMTAILAANLTMIQSWGLAGSLDSPAWSISAEWSAYLVFPIVLTCCLFRNAIWALSAAAVSVIALVLLCTIAQSVGHDPTSQAQALLDITRPDLALPVVRCIAEFTLGVTTFRACQTAWSTRFANSEWSAVMLAIVIAFLLSVPKTDLLITLLFPLLILSLSSNQTASSRVLSFGPFELLGRLSYSIYLVHALMGGLVEWAHGIVEHHGIAHAQTYAAASAIFLTFPCAYLAFRFIEVPGRRLLRGIFEQTKPQSIASEPSAP